MESLLTRRSSDQLATSSSSKWLHRIRHLVETDRDRDLHLETATVRESLQFSAMLRQPKVVSKKEKYDYVEEVIKMLNMADFANAVVGVPGEGLNVEQRKLLTIGVELAAKPKLLLFLDEPTSGLDSQVSTLHVQLGRPQTLHRFCLRTQSALKSSKLPDDRIPTNPRTEFVVNHIVLEEAVFSWTSNTLHHPSTKRHPIPRIRQTPVSS